MTQSLFVSSEWVVSQLVDVSLKSLLLAVVAAAAMRALGFWSDSVKSASVRHRVWAAVLVGMLVMPLVTAWTVAVSLPGWAYPDLQRAGVVDSSRMDEAPLAAVAASESATVIELPTRKQEASQVAFDVPAMPDRLVESAPIVPATERAAPSRGPWKFTAGVYLLGVAFVGTRLLVGLAAARRLVRQARRVDGARLPAIAGAATPVYESSRVRVPLTVGWLRPAIVLPPDWVTWDGAMLDAVLAHERAHVRRGDLFVALLARVNTVVYWFHPLSWFLSRRLTALAESACDDAVIDSLGDRTGYARHLLSVATRLSGAPRRLEPVGVAMAARPMVEQRIEAILDDRRPLARRVGWVGTLLLIVAITPAILLAAGITSKGASDEAVDVGELAVEAIKKAEQRTEAVAKPQAEEEAAKTQVEVTPTAVEADAKLVVRGRVVDSDLRPVAGARLWLPVGFDLANSEWNQVEAATDDQGAFALLVLRKWLEPGVSVPSAVIWCYAPGKCIATAIAFEQVWQHSTEPIAITLPPASNTSFGVMDPDQKPVPGARVEPFHFRVGLQRSYAIIPEDLREILAQTTDVQGRVYMPAIPRDGLSTIQVVSQEYGTQEKSLRDRAGEPALRYVWLRKTGRIEGRLVSDDAKAVGRIPIHVYQDDLDGQYTTGAANIRTDEAGRFVVECFAEGPAQLTVAVDNKLPLRPQIPEKIEVVAGETTNVSIPMVPGVTVQGVVRTQESHRPVPDALVNVNYGSNRQLERIWTDEKGEFDALVPLGLVRQQLIMRPEEFKYWDNETLTWQYPIDVFAVSNTVELPPIELVETFERRGRLIDKAGQPVANGRLSAVVGNRSLAMAMTDERGEFGIWLPKLPAADSYNVHFSRDDPRYEVNVVGEEPLVLQLAR